MWESIHISSGYRFGFEFGSSFNSVVVCMNRFICGKKECFSEFRFSLFYLRCAVAQWRCSCNWYYQNGSNCYCLWYIFSLLFLRISPSSDLSQQNTSHTTTRHAHCVDYCKIVKLIWMKVISGIFSLVSCCR